MSAAWSKILPLPSAAAFCEAELNTFSKTRGTARMNVGWNDAEVGDEVLHVGGVAQAAPGP